MNEQLQAKLVEILANIQAATKKAGDFAMEQLPDIAVQYVLYGRVKTAAVTTFLLLVSAAFFATFRWAYTNPWNASNYSFEKDAKRSESNYLVMVLACVLGSLFAIIGVLSFDWLVWLAPKVWLLKELAGLVR
ncbi:MAG TPA: hypothetical protein PK034_11615 [Rugosibacter sp.]|nr:hypothetical protein [Rugosibacter sp.]